MATLQTDQALFLRQFMLGVLEREHATTRRVIEAIPADKGDYRPDSIVKNANELAWHIVGAEHRFMEAVANGVFDFTNTGRPAELVTSADIARWYADIFPRDATRIAALPADALTKAVDFRGLFQLPAITYLQTAQMHSIHHRGQLSMYLRPMGAKVPAIYGESYDSAQARKDSSR
jgi:uncharacterized damage-inducible protein DinB